MEVRPYISHSRSLAWSATCAALLLVASIASLRQSAHAGLLSDAAAETRRDEPSSSTSPDDDDADKKKNHRVEGGPTCYPWSSCNSSCSSSSSATYNTSTGASEIGAASLNPGAGAFAPFPYSRASAGILVAPGDEEVDNRNYSVRLAFEHSPYIHGITRYSGAAMIDLQSGLAADASGSWYAEQLPGGGHDELAVGDVNLMFGIIRSEHTLWHVGVGVNWLADDLDTEAGVNGTLKVDWFPAKPFICSGEIDYGELGDAHSFHGRCSAGVNISHVEVFIGYDYRKIGHVELEGPMVGAQIWF